MLFYTWICFVLFNLLWPHTNTTIIRDLSSADSSLMLSGFLNNITRVNNVINELIENYRELQALYDTEESIESIETISEKKSKEEFNDYSDEERDRVIKHIINNNHNTVKQIGGTVKAPPVFALQWETDVKGVDDAKKIYVVSQNDPTSDGNDYENSNERLNTDTHGFDSDDDNSDEKMRTGKLALLRLKADKQLTASSSDKVNSEESDTSKESGAVASSPWRHGKSYTANKIRVKLSNKDKKIPNNGYTISNILELNKKRNVQSKVLEPILYKDKDEDFSEEELKQDLIKTHALRAAYGDACVKLVVRKCFKACKKTVKEVCRSTSCRSKVKSKLRSTAKSQCISSFSSSGKNSRAQTSNLKNYDEEMDFVDMTRQGDLATYCLAETRSPTTTIDEDGQLFRNKTTNSASSDNNMSEVNILRDKYERACAKASRRKCNNACKNTFKDVCEEEECKKPIRRRYRKECKKKCKEAFGSTKKYDSDESSTDEDD